MISRETLRRNIMRGTKISGAEQLLPSESTWSNWVTDPLSLPPFLIAAFQERGDADSNEAISSFEALSLEIRRHAFAADAKSQRAITPTDGGGFSVDNTCRAEDLVSAMRDVCRSLSHRSERGDPQPPPQSIRKRRFRTDDTSEIVGVPALKLVGIKIEGHLDLSKLDIPFSIRLVDCWIDGALLLDRTKMITLDLSGSVITYGASCNYMETRGAVRLRRSVFSGPLDLGGATIGATLDASDCVIVPKHLPPLSISFVGDRHALNLALSSVHKEVRMNRARIYGGANLRGATIGGSVFLDDAIVYSPVGMAERVLCDQVIAAGGSVPADWQACVYLEKELVAMIRAQDPPSQKKRTLGLERLEHLDVWDPVTASHPQSRSVLIKLIEENGSAATSAVRAEGSSIGGNLSSRGSLFVGKANLKYLQVKGRVALNGSWFRYRGVGALFRRFGAPSLAAANDLELEAYVECITDAITRNAKIDPSDRGHTALDLRDSDIGGTLDLRRDERANARPQWRSPLIRMITFRMCLSGEDPVKFIPLFFPKSGEAFKWRERAKQITNLLSQRDADLQKGLDCVEKIGAQVDRKFYEYERNIRNIRFPPGATPPTPAEADVEIALLPPPDAQIFPGYAKRRAVLTELTAKDVSHQLTEIFRAVGSLRSVIVSGELALSGASIGGALRAKYALINIVPALSTSDSLLLQNANINGDVDLRDSVGFSRILAQQVHISGSLKLCGRSSDNPRAGRSRPLRERALLPFSSTPKGAEHCFSGAQIGGNALFVFDRVKGPTLDLSNAKIGNRLFIMPAIGGLELSDEEYDKLVETNEYKTRGSKAGSVLTSFGLAIELFASNLWRKVPLLVHRTGPPRYFLARAKSIIDARDDRGRYRPTIDLRNTETRSFAHPPSAWPQQDFLRIEGFRYELTSQLGPLVPPRRTWNHLLRDIERNRKPVWHLAVVSAFFMAAATAAYVYPVEIKHTLGEETVFAALAIITVWVLKNLLSAITYPRAADQRPRALDWLALQHRRFNTGRVQAALVPFQPFIQAAAVLRTAGRMRAANQVELNRLRIRRRMLSFRHSAPMRLVLLLTDWVMEYGFKPMRAAAIIAIAVLFGSAAVNIANSQSGVLASDIHRLELELRSLDSDKDINTTLGRTPATVPPNYPHFNAIFYSIDTVLPIIDLGQEKYWSVQLQEVGPKSDTPSLVGKWIVGVCNWILKNLFVLLRIFGWTLTALVSVAVVARMETVIARNEG